MISGGLRLRNFIAARKSEFRNSNVEGNSKPECRNPKQAHTLQGRARSGRLELRNSSFEFVSAFGFRVSSFPLKLLFHRGAARLAPLREVERDQPENVRRRDFEIGDEVLHFVAE